MVGRDKREHDRLREALLEAQEAAETYHAAWIDAQTYWKGKVHRLEVELQAVIENRDLMEEERDEFRDRVANLEERQVTAGLLVTALDAEVERERVEARRVIDAECENKHRLVAELLNTESERDSLRSLLGECFTQLQRMSKGGLCSLSDPKELTEFHRVWMRAEAALSASAVVPSNGAREGGLEAPPGA